MPRHAAIADPPATDPAQPLLGADDPAPVEILRPDGLGPLLLICDHAGNAIPAALDGLGVDPARLEEHIAWDIGAGDLARALSARFDAPLVLSRYSRLVIDCNRAPSDPTSIIPVSDGIPIPGNQELTPAEVERRREAVFRPYHRAVAEIIAERTGRGEQPALVSVHSFTPVFAGFRRPWQVGVLWNRDGRLALPFMDALLAEGLVVGDNEPYSARESFGDSVEIHGEATGLPHLLLEVRQDLIDTPEGVERWADTIGRALGKALRALVPA